MLLGEQHSDPLGLAAAGGDVHVDHCAAGLPASTIGLRPPELPHLEVKGPLEVAQAQAEQRQVCSAETSGSWLCCCNAIIPYS